MNKLLCLIVLAIMVITNVSANAQKEVVIFSQPCHFCDLLKQDLQDSLMAQYPDIKFTVLDIREKNNRRLLDKYVRKYDLRGDIGLPLVFVGENYLMGWSDAKKDELKKDIENYRQEKISRLPSSLQ